MVLWQGNCLKGLTCFYPVIRCYQHRCIPVDTNAFLWSYCVPGSNGGTWLKLHIKAVMMKKMPGSFL